MGEREGLITSKEMETGFFTVIEVNRQRSISEGILSMLSDIYDNIVSLSVSDTDACPMVLHCTAILRLPVIHSNSILD